MALPDKSTYSAVGGELAYDAPEDPSADVTDDASNEARADGAAMTRMIGRAYVVFTTDAMTCTVVDHDAVWGNGLSVKPTIARAGAGYYDVTWPSAVADARAVTRSVNLRSGLGNIEQPGAFVNALRTSPHVFRVITNSIAAAGPDEFVATLITLIVW